MSQLLFDTEAKKWTEAIPIGNGFLGAMVFGGVMEERIQVNEDSVWAGGYRNRINPDANENLEKVRALLKDGQVVKAQSLVEKTMYATNPHMPHYQKLADIWIHFHEMNEKQKVVYINDKFPLLTNEKPHISDYTRSLDLENAIGKIQYKKNGNIQKREFFASNPDSVIVYKIESNHSDLNLDIEVTRKDNRHGHGATYLDDIYVMNNNTICVSGMNGGFNGIGFELDVKVICEKGKQCRMGSRVVVENAKTVYMYVSARTTYRTKNIHDWCLETLSNVPSYSLLKKRHIKDYKLLFDACTLDLHHHKMDLVPTNLRLQKIREGNQDVGLYNTYFDYGKYLIISSSREGSLPANLQGIWNDDFEPSWGSKYTININTEMNYWLVEKTGLSSLHMPLMEHLKKMRVHGKEVAEKMYGARGFCCHHNTDIWGDCAPQDQSVGSTLWPMGAAWLCLHLIEHYEYSKDKDFIIEYYEILKDSVLFFLDYLVKDKNGNWITGPSTSPENIFKNENGEYGSLCMGPYMDVEILTELFDGFIKISQELGIRDEIVYEAKAKLSHFPKLKIGDYGQIQEWQEDYEELDKGHRHISQLFALYPGSQIRVDKTPELARAAKLTLDSRLENGGGHTGWSKAWIIHFFARLWDGENAEKHLCELLKNATLDNLFDNHPPFQIDGNFGGANAILEMIVQDYESKVYLLPAISELLQEGSLKGLRLKNGAILDLEWELGKIKTINVFAKRDCSFDVYYVNEVMVHVELKKNENIIIGGNEICNMKS